MCNILALMDGLRHARRPRCETPGLFEQIRRHSSGIIGLHLSDRRKGENQIGSLRAHPFGGRSCDLFPCAQYPSTNGQRCGELKGNKQRAVG